MKTRTGVADAAYRLAIRARRALRDGGRLYWYDVANFGDQVGPFLYRRIAGREPVHIQPDDSPWNAVYMTAGSIVHEIRGNSIVWGCGIIERETRFPRPLLTTAVRGPLTRQRFLDLGYRCPTVFGDPALALPRFLPMKQTFEYEVGLVPHYVDYDVTSLCAAESDGVLLIDVRRPVEQVVQDIARCRAVVSSSLHGLITAHAYGIPAVPVSFGDRLYGDNVKFIDYALSVGIEKPVVKPVVLRPQGAQDWLRLIDGEWEPRHLAEVVDPLLQVCPFRNPARFQRGEH